MQAPLFLMIISCATGTLHMHTDLPNSKFLNGWNTSTSTDYTTEYSANKMSAGTVDVYGRLIKTLTQHDLVVRSVNITPCKTHNCPVPGNVPGSRTAPSTSAPFIATASPLASTLKTLDKTAIWENVTTDTIMPAECLGTAGTSVMAVTATHTTYHIAGQASIVGLAQTGNLGAAAVKVNFHITLGSQCNGTAAYNSMGQPNAFQLPVNDTAVPAIIAKIDDLETKVTPTLAKAKLCLDVALDFIQIVQNWRQLLHLGLIAENGGQWALDAVRA